MASEKTTTIDEQQVIEFLLQHTSFFNDHPELLFELSLPYKDGNILSLPQKQVEVLRAKAVVLRDKGIHAQQKFESFMSIAEKNEKLSICLHRLSLKLLSKHEVEAVTHESIKTLRAQFPANQIVIRLFAPYAERSKTAQPLDAKDPILKTLMLLIFSAAKPDCGPFSSVQKKALFGNFSQRIQSAVVMPLQFRKKKIGLLLLGSPRADAFVPGKSTMLLVQFGELIATAVAACAHD